ncbi:MAG: DUF973 family protein [Methanomassiliicoccales archaeon]
MGEKDKARVMQALRRLKIFALISIISIVFTFTVLIIAPNATSSVISSLSLHTSSKAASGVSWLLLGLEVAIGVLGICGIFFLITAFRDLSQENAMFNTPYKLSRVVLIGIVLLVVSLVLIAAADSAIVVPPSGHTGAATLSYFVLFLLLLAAILAIVSLILLIIGLIGLIVGIWRLGTRFDRPMFKIAAILYIIPVLDIIAPFLILGATYAVEREIQG